MHGVRRQVLSGSVGAQKHRLALLFPDAVHDVSDNPFFLIRAKKVELDQVDIPKY